MSFRKATHHTTDGYLDLYHRIFCEEISDPPKDYKKNIDDAVKTITNFSERNLLICEMFFGMKDQPERYTYAEIANMFGISTTRVSMIVDKFIRFLRYPRRDIVLFGLDYYQKKTNQQLNDLKKYVGYIQGIETLCKGIHVEELEVSVRCFNCLKRAGCDNMYDLLNKLFEPWGFYKIRNMGRKSYEEIRSKMLDFLNQIGISITESEFNQISTGDIPENITIDSLLNNTFQESITVLNQINSATRKSRLEGVLITPDSLDRIKDVLQNFKTTEIPFSVRVTNLLYQYGCDNLYKIITRIIDGNLYKINGFGNLSCGEVVDRTLAVLDGYGADTSWLARRASLCFSIFP